MAKYIIGIDLGTTNSALAFAPLDTESSAREMLEIPQVVAAGECSSLKLLPSFLYLPHEGEFEPAALDLPWTAPVDGRLPWVIGTFARDHGAKRARTARQFGQKLAFLRNSGPQRRRSAPHSAGRPGEDLARRRFRGLSGPPA